MLNTWQRELNQMVKLYGSKWVKWLSPKIKVKQGYFSPFYLPGLWFTKRKTAWTMVNLVIVSSELINTSELERRYLLAHELGHIQHMHYFKALALIISLFIMVIISSLLHKPILSHLALFGVTGLLLLLFEKAEYQADAFAAQILGRKKVIKAMLKIAERNGMTKQRIKRLKKLGYKNII